MNKTASHVTITEVTRRAICDELTVSNVPWSGRLSEGDFLARLYDLKEMPSTDGRYSNAADDIWKHREMNDDWGGQDWIFTDSRFDLFRCPDEEFLGFLCETVHPVIRTDAEEVERLVSVYNGHLAPDGWELVPQTFISQHPVFAAHRRLLPDHATPVVAAIASALSAEYINRQITRMQTETDPELAIGTAKELVETVCKAILEERGVPENPKWEVPQLVKATVSTLKLTPDNIPDTAKGAEPIRILLGSLASIAGRLAEIRNLYGTGHGKAPSAARLSPRHARLAVGAAATLVAFLFETHRERN